jgi:hypothetical protein
MATADGIVLPPTMAAQIRIRAKTTEAPTLAAAANGLRGPLPWKSLKISARLAVASSNAAR